VMSDWGASHQVTDVAKGLDLEMPTGQNLSQAKITAALAAGTATVTARYSSDTTNVATATVVVTSISGS